MIQQSERQCITAASRNCCSNQLQRRLHRVFNVFTNSTQYSSASPTKATRPLAGPRPLIPHQELNRRPKFLSSDIHRVRKKRG